MKMVVVPVGENLYGVLHITIMEAFLVRWEVLGVVVFSNHQNLMFLQY